MEFVSSPAPSKTQDEQGDPFEGNNDQQLPGTKSGHQPGWGRARKGCRCSRYIVWHFGYAGGVQGNFVCWPGSRAVHLYVSKSRVKIPKPQMFLQTFYNWPDIDSRIWYPICIGISFQTDGSKFRIAGSSSLEVVDQVWSRLPIVDLSFADCQCFPKAEKMETKKLASQVTKGWCLWKVQFSGLRRGIVGRVSIVAFDFILYFVPSPFPVWLFPAVPATPFSPPKEAKLASWHCSGPHVGFWMFWCALALPFGILGLGLERSLERFGSAGSRRIQTKHCLWILWTCRAKAPKEATKEDEADPARYLGVPEFGGPNDTWPETDGHATSI